MAQAGASSARIPVGAPRPGETFAGKYRIDRLLGRGGMGLVLAATHLQLKERVAIKVLLPESARDAETVHRFVREAQAAVKIKSEHVGKVFDAGVEDGKPYMVMEYLEGHDLSRVLRERRRLPVAVAVDYVLQACEAVAEAHARKIVHRDLKPSNLFLTTGSNGRECVKVLDFGISKLSAPEDVAGELVSTKTAVMLGSPLYMSPEQLRSSKHVAEHTDIWALGVILYELVAGVPPFDARTLPELGALVLSGPTPWLHRAVAACPMEFAQVVATCLAKEPADRYASLAELADALAPFGSPDALVSRDRIAAVLGRAPGAVTAPPPVPSEPTAGTAPTPAATSPPVRTERLSGGPPGARAIASTTAPLVAAPIRSVPPVGTTSPPRSWLALALGGAAVSVAIAGVAIATRTAGGASAISATSASARSGSPIESAAPQPSLGLALPVAEPGPEPPASASPKSEPGASAVPAVSTAPKAASRVGKRKPEKQAEVASPAPSALPPKSELAPNRTDDTK